MNPALEMASSNQSQFEDGTNVIVGTKFREEPGSRVLPWYNPAEAQGILTWKEGFKSLRARFDRLTDEFCPAECFLVQTLVPACGVSPTASPPVLPDRTLLWQGPGLGREPAKLLTPTWEPLRGVFPITSVHGEPILRTDQSPVAYPWPEGKDGAKRDWRNDLKDGKEICGNWTGSRLHRELLDLEAASAGWT